MVVPSAGRAGLCEAKRRRLGPLGSHPAQGPVFVGYAAVDSTPPLRHAGLAIGSDFLLSLLVLPFAPGTKGRPLLD